MSRPLGNPYSFQAAFLEAALTTVTRLVAEVALAGVVADIALAYIVDIALAYVVNIALAYVAHNRILGTKKALPLKQKISKRGISSLMSYRLHTPSVKGLKAFSWCPELSILL